MWSLHFVCSRRFRVVRLPIKPVTTACFILTNSELTPSQGLTDWDLSYIRSVVAIHLVVCIRNQRLPVYNFLPNRGTRIIYGVSHNSEDCGNGTQLTQVSKWVRLAPHEGGLRISCSGCDKECARETRLRGQGAGHYHNSLRGHNKRNCFVVHVDTYSSVSYFPWTEV